MSALILSLLLIGCGQQKRLSGLYVRTIQPQNYLIDEMTLTKDGKVDRRKSVITNEGELVMSLDQGNYHIVNQYLILTFVGKPGGMLTEEMPLRASETRTDSLEILKTKVGTILVESSRKCYVLEEDLPLRVTRSDVIPLEEH